MSKTGGRATRMECLKLAVNIVIQLKDPKISITGLAQQFMAFVDAHDDRDDDDIDEPEATSERPRGTYTKRDLRRGIVTLSKS